MSDNQEDFLGEAFILNLEGFQQVGRRRKQYEQGHVWETARDPQKELLQAVCEISALLWVSRQLELGRLHLGWWLQARMAPVASLALY